MTTRAAHRRVQLLIAFFAFLNLTVWATKELLG